MIEIKSFTNIDSLVCQDKIDSHLVKGAVCPNCTVCIEIHLELELDLGQVVLSALKFTLSVLAAEQYTVLL